MGTATYFSPEQAQGLDLDGRSDVYSLGVVLYEMLTGVAPFIADNPVSVAYKHVREEPVPPSRVNAEVPEAMDRVVLTAMQKDPARRYQSADDLRADLLRFERGRPVVGGPILPPVAAGPGAASRPRRFRVRWRRNRRATSATGARWSPSAIAFVLLLALIVVLLVQSDFGETTAAGPKADVPPVIGQQYAQAEATLTGLQFKVVRVDADSDQAADQVLDQNPEAGSRVGEGQHRHAHGEQRHHRDARHHRQDAAGSGRGHAGQAPEAVLHARRISDKTPGTVVETLPAAGAQDPEAPAGSSRPGDHRVPRAGAAGRDPRRDGAGPDRGHRGAEPGRVPHRRPRTDTPSDTIPFGQVIGTDPPAGTPTPKVATIKLLVSTGPSADRGAERRRADAGRRGRAAAGSRAST